MEAPLARVVIAHADAEDERRSVLAAAGLPLEVTLTRPSEALANVERLLRDDADGPVLLVQDASAMRRKAALRAGAFGVHEGPLTIADMRRHVFELDRESMPLPR